MSQLISFSKVKIILTLMVLFFLQSTFAQKVYTIGPMFHLNFGDKKLQPSWGVECAYWDFSSSQPFGIDLGIEFQQHKYRVYSEFQTGIIFVGTGLGMGVEFQKEIKPKLFLQGSLWANAIIGIDLRFRTRKEDFFATGVYTKIPIMPGGLKKFNLEYDKNHQNNTNTSHSYHHDWFD